MSLKGNRKVHASSSNKLARVAREVYEIIPNVSKVYGIDPLAGISDIVVSNCVVLIAELGYYTRDTRIDTPHLRFLLYLYPTCPSA